MRARTVNLPGILVHMLFLPPDTGSNILTLGASKMHRMHIALVVQLTFRFEKVPHAHEWHLRARTMRPV